MAQLLLSKAALLKERRQLSAFQKFLPSLEMKRQQLILALKRSEDTMQAIDDQLNDIDALMAEQVPMLANQDIQLEPLLSIHAIEYQQENIAGVVIKRLAEVQFEISPMSVMSRPHWVEYVQHWLQQAVQLRLQLDAEQHIHHALQAALSKVTQRMNLFDKVLIPQAQKNIRRIQIHLDDKAREAVVTSKIAKQKRLEAQV